MFDRVKILKSKLDALRKMDTRFQIFGANYHRYILNPPLTEEQVLTFEREHRIALPEDYHAFIFSVGNGGAGPCYGLFPMQDYDFELNDLKEDFLSCAFPHQGPWTPDTEAPDSELTEEEYFANHWVQGAMRICHYGCAMYGLLVVSGPERGKVYLDSRANGGGIIPESEDFFTWYNRWLERSLQEVSRDQRVKSWIRCLKTLITPRPV